MTRPVDASLEFLNVSPDKKIPAGADIANGLKNHTETFSNPPVKPEDLLNLNSDLTDAAAKARTGNKQSIDDMHNVEKKWETAFRRAAKYVGTIANGDAAVIRLGGCTPTASENLPQHPPDASKNVESAPGHRTATIGCASDTNAKGYVYVAYSDGGSAGRRYPCF